MSIRSLKQRADQLASDAGESRLERNRSAARCLAILRQRAGSPVGLAVCFGAGLVAGSRTDRHEAIADESDDTDRGDRESVAMHALRGPAGAAAIKLASAFIAGALMRPDEKIEGQ